MQRPKVTRGACTVCGVRGAGCRGPGPPGVLGVGSAPRTPATWGGCRRRAGLLHVAQQGWRGPPGLLTRGGSHPNPPAAPQGDHGGREPMGRTAGGGSPGDLRGCGGVGGERRGKPVYTHSPKNLSRNPHPGRPAGSAAHTDVPGSPGHDTLHTPPRHPRHRAPQTLCPAPSGLHCQGLETAAPAGSGRVWGSGAPRGHPPPAPPTSAHPHPAELGPLPTMAASSDLGPLPTWAPHHDPPLQSRPGKQPGCAFGGCPGHADAGRTPGRSVSCLQVTPRRRLGPRCPRSRELGPSWGNEGPQAGGAAPLEDGSVRTR